MKNFFLNGKISPIVPKTGGGLSMETHLIEYSQKKYILRLCKSERRARSYEFISKKLSAYNILPKLLGRDGKNIFYEYLSGRDLKQNESLKIFKEVGIICAKINNLKYQWKGGINLSFNKHLNELTTGNYKQFTQKEIKEKRARRPNERHDRRRIKSLIGREEKEKIRTLNKKLIIKTKAMVSLDAFDVSPANFRLSKGKVYFVDIDAIKPKIRGIGIAKCFFGWAGNPKQKESFLKGYFSVSKTDFLTEEYMDLLNLHFLIQALHDRAKIGRDYKIFYKKLKKLLKKY